MTHNTAAATTFVYPTGYMCIIHTVACKYDLTQKLGMRIYVMKHILTIRKHLTESKFWERGNRESNAKAKHKIRADNNKQDWKRNFSEIKANGTAKPCPFILIASIADNISTLFWHTNRIYVMCLPLHRSTRSAAHSLHMHVHMSTSPPPNSSWTNSHKKKQISAGQMHEAINGKTL